MKKTIALLWQMKALLLGLTLAAGLSAQLIPLGGCNAGDDFVYNGDYYCWYANTGSYDYPNWEFICEPEGECLDHCYPSICALVDPGSANDPQADNDRRRIPMQKRKHD